MWLLSTITLSLKQMLSLLTYAQLLTLIAAGIGSTQTLVLASAGDASNLAILMQARVLNPRIWIINHLFNTSLGDRLDQTSSVTAKAAPVFAVDALGNQALT